MDDPELEFLLREPDAPVEIHHHGPTFDPGHEVTHTRHEFLRFRHAHPDWGFTNVAPAPPSEIPQAAIAPPSPPTPKGLYTQDQLDAKVSELFASETSSASLSWSCRECGASVAGHHNRANHAAWHIRLDDRIYEALHAGPELIG